MKRKENRPIQRRDLIGFPMFGVKVTDAYLTKSWSNPNHKDIFGHSVLSIMGTDLVTGEFQRFDVDLENNKRL